MFRSIRKKYRQIKGRYYAIRRRGIQKQRKTEYYLKFLFLPILIPKYLGEQIVWGHLPRFELILLKTESPIERKLYYAIRHLYPRRIVAQYPYGPYYLDFAIPELKVCFEADGKTYHGSSKQKERDRRRDQYLTKRGWKVKRFSYNRIMNKIDGVVNEIIKTVDQIEQTKENRIN